MQGRQTTSNYNPLSCPIYPRHKGPISLVECDLLGQWRNCGTCPDNIWQNSKTKSITLVVYHDCGGLSQRDSRSNLARTLIHLKSGGLTSLAFICMQACPILLITLSPTSSYVVQPNPTLPYIQQNAPQLTWHKGPGSLSQRDSRVMGTLHRTRSRSLVATA
jgi:hypothetical protein